MKKTFLSGAVIFFAARSFGSGPVIENTAYVFEPINFGFLMESGFNLLAGIVAFALTAWCVWLLVRKALPWVAVAFGGWFSDLFSYLDEKEKQEQWEADGKPYYIMDEDGKYERVSAFRYENYLLDRGFNPETARSYMKEHGYDPSLPPPEVLDDDDDF